MISVQVRRSVVHTVSIFLMADCYGRAWGVRVRSFAGHCSEGSGNSRSLPVIRSTVMA